MPVGSEPHPTPSKGQRSLPDHLEEIVEVLSTEKGKDEVAERWNRSSTRAEEDSDASLTLLASQIHQLMDSIPVKPNGETRYKH